MTDQEIAEGIADCLEDECLLYFFEADLEKACRLLSYIESQIIRPRIVEESMKFNSLSKYVN